MAVNNLCKYPVYQSVSKQGESAIDEIKSHIVEIQRVMYLQLVNRDKKLVKTRGFLVKILVKNERFYQVFCLALYDKEGKLKVD